MDKISISELLTASTELATIPVSKMGPAMRRCTPLQQAFVMALNTGAPDATAAAAQAGYATASHGSLKWTAHWLMHNEKVRAAMWEECQRTINFMVPGVLTALHKIAMDVMHKDQAKAIGMIMSRGGMPEVTRTEVTATLTVDEEAREVVAMAKELGIDPAKIVGRRKLEAIDAEFEEVDPRLEGIPL